ncbi:MAG: histidine kinase dimerization/phospho-acceptor domain-containing protein, partial [Myxococcota bacterium]
LLTVDSAIKQIQLERQNTQLLADSQRRLAALDVMHEINRHAASYTHYGDIVDRATTLLERVVPLDVSATLVTDSSQGRASLTLRCRTPITESLLEKLKYDTLERHRALTNQHIGESDVVVRITGRRTGNQEFESTGSPRDFRSRLYIPLHSEGKATGMLAVASLRSEAFSADDEKVLDILANQTAEVIEALRDKLDFERRRMHNMLEGMSDGVIMTNASGEIVAANASARNLLGVEKPEELTVALLRERIDFDPFLMARSWERYGVKPVSKQLTIGERLVHSLINPIVEPSGQLSGAVVALRDNTEQQTFASHRHEAMSIVSHELRTPLTSVSGTLDLLLSGNVGPLRDDQRRYIKLARQSAY